MKKYFIVLSVLFVLFMGLGVNWLGKYNASIKTAEKTFIEGTKTRLNTVVEELSKSLASIKQTLEKLEKTEDSTLIEAATAANSLIEEIEILDNPEQKGKGAGVSVVHGRLKAYLSNEELNKTLAHSRVSTNSILFLVDSNDNIVFHPGRNLDKGHVNLAEYAALEEIASLSLLGAMSKNKKNGVIDLYADDSKEHMWGFVQPIAGTELSLAAVTLKTPVLRPQKHQQQTLFSGIIAVILGLTVICVALSLAFTKSEHSRAWWASSTFSAIMLLGTVVLCLFSHNNLDYSYENEVPLTEPAMLESYLSELDIKANNLGIGDTTKIPTGIFLNTIEIESAVNIRISGIIWQKFDLSAPPVTEGVFFPDANDVTLEEIYNQTNGDIKTIGYSFDILMRESFSGIRYPFDVEAIWVRMLPKEFYKNIILVPDFNDYNVVAPELMPGVDKDLILPSWKLKKSFFSYLTYNYNTNFGLINSIGSNILPELYFNVTVQRNFLDPFLSIILPLIVVAVLVFILLLTCSCDESKFEKLGFSAGAVLSGIAALFFVVIIAQIDLRKNIAAEQIIYVDFYYFVIYMVFLLVSINSLLICWPQRYKLLCRGDNLIVKTLYWPFIFSTLFAATIFYFYP